MSKFFDLVWKHVLAPAGRFISTQWGKLDWRVQIAVAGVLIASIGITGAVMVYGALNTPEEPKLVSMRLDGNIINSNMDFHVAEDGQFSGTQPRMEQRAVFAGSGIFTLNYADGSKRTHEWAEFDVIYDVDERVFYLPLVTIKCNPLCVITASVHNFEPVLQMTPK